MFLAAAAGLLVVSLLYVFRTRATSQPVNMLRVASVVPLGNRLATNDQSIRDLGYQGQVGAYNLDSSRPDSCADRAGNFWINTFGDGVGCFNAATEDTCGDGCAWLTGRDGGALQGEDPLSFHDLNVTTDYCGGVPQMAPFCPVLYDLGETNSSGLGITNVVPVNSTHGLLLTRPTYSDSLESPGAGLAAVHVTSGVPVCTRPFGSEYHQGTLE